MTKTSSRRHSRTPGLVLAAAASLWLACSCGCRPKEEAAPKPKGDPPATAPATGPSARGVSKLLTATKLPNLDGKVRPLSEYLGPNGLVLVFVDTVCPSAGVCIKDTPEIARALKAHKVNPVLINIDEAREFVLRFYKANDVGAVVVYDTTAKTTEQWNVHMVPTIMFFNAEGALAYRGNGLWRKLGDAMAPALGMAPGSIRFRPVGTAVG